MEKEKKEEETKEQPKKYKLLTEEEKKEINKKTEYKSGFLVRFVRIIRDNPDLIVLGIIIVLFCLAGYWIAIIKLGMTTEQIKLRVWDFVEFVGIVLLGVAALVGKLFIAQGTITKNLSKTASKEADLSGNTILKN